MSDIWQETNKFFVERGFARKIGFGKRPAVIVIDIIGAFTNPDLPLGTNLEQVINETKKVLNVSRQADIPIFFSTLSYDDKDLKDAGVWALKQGGLVTLRSGTPEAEVEPRLERRLSEPLIVKKYASVFFGTDLFTRLNTLGIDTLILTGCTTSGCVRATAVDGLQYGFRVIVAEEAVGDRADMAHKQSLFDLNAKYADVVSVTEVLHFLSSLKIPINEEKKV
ncbi:carbamoylsarcosine amidase [Bacillus canaveralius]|uniref:Carbamoylsarcosine amidase n=1 Tax=Bacillus canaveralius TaxID=1403243 RepID=A0A2N5GMQ1_9BACI|nr:isochorismatase family protein [Bacillus canaveralius]PLR83272.1 carbamoylsarcosine amidase [Bacillus canaveralius]PLR96681.1 carbamoylsarcosine amidase [Bacillus canaveralius]RSK55235.1 isochorismatase family protein [Bacillus canaveralius]